MDDDEQTSGCNDRLPRTRRLVADGGVDTTRVTIGDNATIADPDSVGYVYDSTAKPATIGNDATIRSGTVIYADVTIGDRFTTGHNAVVREETTIGDDVVVGTNVVIDGNTTIGSTVSFQTGAYVPNGTTIGDDVFVGPHAVLTNDLYPVRMERPLVGPTIHAGVSIGANATILPGVEIGTNAFIAAGSVVTADIPEDTLAIGVPARTRPLPTELVGPNAI